MDVNNNKDEKNRRENMYNKDTLKQIEERKNRFSGLTSYELLKIAKLNSGFPKELSKNTRFHLNIDTGMSRFGFRADELLKTSTFQYANKLLSDGQYEKATGLFESLLQYSILTFTNLWPHP